MDQAVRRALPPSSGALDLPTLLLDADATSQSAYDWFNVAQAEGFEIPENLVVERYPLDDIAEYIIAKLIIPPGRPT